MQVRIMNDSVEVSGYVNAVERNSKPLRSRLGRFVERISKGAFSSALKRNDDVHLLLNHDWTRDLGSTREGNLELTEDSIGLHARATITDADVVEKARNGKLVGWSFGFTDKDVDEERDKDMPLRIVRDLNLYEVSILDNSKSPAYEGTLIMARSDEDVQYFGEDMITEIETRDDSVEEVAHEDTDVETRDIETTEQVEKIDYSEFENIIKEMRED